MTSKQECPKAEVKAVVSSNCCNQEITPSDTISENEATCKCYCDRPKFWEAELETFINLDSPDSSIKVPPTPAPSIYRRLGRRSCDREQMNATSHLDILTTQQYLEQLVLPLITEGFYAICRDMPKEPILYLKDYFLKGEPECRPADSYDQIVKVCHQHNMSKKRNEKE